MTIDTFTADLPPGLHQLGSPLVSPAVQGWRMSGAGMACVIDGSPWHDHLSGPATRIEAELHSPAIRAGGGYWTIENLTLLGNGQPNDIGVKIAQRGAFGGAAGLLRRCSFMDFDDAIRTAHSEGDTGNDNHALDDLYFGYCDNCLTIGARQSMHFVCRRWNVRYQDAVVRVEAGGKFSLDGLDVDCSGTILHTVGDESMIAGNNGSFTFRNVTVDGGGQVLTLVNQEQEHWLRATFDNVHFPVSTPEREYACRVTLRGAESRAVLRGIHNLPRDTRVTLHKGATCVIEGCDLPATPENLLTRESVGTLLALNCWHEGRFFSRWSAAIGRAKGVAA